MSDVNISVLADTVEYIRNKLDMVAEAIVGDPTDEFKPGILIRLDRLERSAAGQKKTLIAFGSGLVTIVGVVTAAVILRFV